MNLSRYVVRQRSMSFVLDTYFEHWKQHQLSKEFIIDVFQELDDKDYFGLIMRQEHRRTIDALDI